MSTPLNRPGLGIALILVGVTAISINDMLIKALSGGYPLHEMVFIRSAIGLMFSFVFLHFEGGWRELKTDRPGLHALRGLMIVFANMTYFAALAVLPLADATALFFVSPLMITLLSVPILGEKVGPWRLGAVLVGFFGVLMMLQSWRGEAAPADVSLLILSLPILAAFGYALNVVLTRKLGVTSKASALAIYIQLTFILVSSGFYLVAGDGRFAEGASNESVIFLLRAWTLPVGNDRWLFLALGINSGLVGYTLSAAYRLADAATIAPFEYIGLPLAVFWGWLVWSEFPAPMVLFGIALILAAGLFVFLRERLKERRRIPRRY